MDLAQHLLGVVVGVERAGVVDAGEAGVGERQLVPVAAHQHDVGVAAAAPGRDLEHGARDVEADDQRAGGGGGQRPGEQPRAARKIEQRAGRAVERQRALVDEELAREAAHRRASASTGEHAHEGRTPHALVEPCDQRALHQALLGGRRRGLGVTGGQQVEIAGAGVDREAAGAAQRAADRQGAGAPALRAHQERNDVWIHCDRCTRIAPSRFARRATSSRRRR